MVPLMIVDWLDNWPIGLKLNRELSKFCSQTFLVIISSWSCRLLLCELGGGTDVFLDWLPRALEIAFYGFTCLGFLGVSSLVAFLADVIQVTTLHLHMCYVIITTVVRGLKLCTSTLWNLFQGIFL